MTKAEVISIIGTKSISKEKIDAIGGSMLQVSTVPKPFREFEFYDLFFSKSEGLLKVIAVSVDIHTSEEGTELREHYTSLKALLTSNYSDSKELDSVKSDADENLSEPRFFMLGLLQNERELFCVWPADDKSKLKDGIGGIVLEAKASQLDTGYLQLTYEFSGWDQYVDKLRAAEGTVL